MSLLDRIRSGEYVADEAKPPTGGSVTLADTARRIAAGEERMHPIRDFLDQVPRVTDEELAELIRERPVPTKDVKADALLAGIAEHFAATRDLPFPAWTREEERFLDRFWFVSDEPRFRAVALAQAPVALKRRGILWPARSLGRV